MVKGIAIAVLAALSIGYAVWSFQTLHRSVWFFTVVIIVTLIYDYMISIQFSYIWEEATYRILTKREKAKRVLTTLSVVGIILLVTWCIGFVIGGLCFDYQPIIWEDYFIPGFLCVFVIYLAGIIVTAIIHILSKAKRRKFTWYLIKIAMKWLIIIGASIAVAGTLLYYLIPLAKTL